MDRKRSRTVETLEEPTEKPVAEEAPAKVEETPAATKGTECTHPLNDTGYHQKSGDGTCRYCGQ